MKCKKCKKPVHCVQQSTEDNVVSRVYHCPTCGLSIYTTEKEDPTRAGIDFLAALAKEIEKGVFDDDKK